MASSYHGPTPVTSDDLKMAKEHLKATAKLNKQKIKDHKKAMKRAIDQDDKKSFKYNKVHKEGHETDMKQVQRSMKTVNNLSARTYDDVRKDKVALMSKRAEVS